MGSDAQHEHFHPDRMSDVAEALFSDCIDRLNAGLPVDLDALLLEHPEIGPQVVQHLRLFEGVDDIGDSNLPMPPPLGTLGDYTLRRQIGRGGMGVVYEAWQGSVERQVALKILPAGIAADPRAVSRFAREARVAARIQHPNVVSVFGMGVEAETPYYAMEYVEGETLAQVLGKLKEAEDTVETPFGVPTEQQYYLNWAKAFADVADGLQHAHSKSVIHRDIKPSNLILDADARLRVLDFGLARLEGQESLTFSGDVVGTPAYMSPEQARRRKIPVDHRTDVYSLGATLYELLTHQQLFRGKDHNDTLSQILERDPRPPRQLNGRVPQDLETIVLKCLRKDAGDRYGTAEALGQDLRRFVRGDTIEARAVAPLERLRRRLWQARSQVAVSAGVLLLALLSGLLAVNYHQQERNREQREQAAKEAEYENLVTRAVSRIPLAGPSLRLVQGDDAHEWRWLLHLLDDPSYAETPGVLEGGQGALENLEAAIELLPNRPGAYYHRARGLWFLGREDEALEALERLKRVIPDFVPSRALRAAIYLGRGEDDLAAHEREDAKRFAEVEWVDDWFVAQQSAAAERWQEAAAAYDRLIDRQQAVAPLFTGSELELRLGRAVARLEADDLDGASRDFFRIVERYPNTLAPAFLAGHTYLVAGREDAARDWFAEYLGEDHVPVAAIYEFLFSLHRSSPEAIILWLEAMPASLGRDRALMLFLALSRHPERALDLGDAILEREPNDALTLALLGNASTRVSAELPEVRQLLARAAEAGDGDPAVFQILCYAYAWLGTQRDWEEVEALARRALELRPGFMWAQTSLAFALKWQRKLEECTETLEAWIVTQPEYADLRAQLGECYEDQGRFAESERVLREALRLEPGSPNVLLSLGLLLRNHPDRLRESEACLRKAVATGPHWPETKGFHAKSLAALERLDEALEVACDALIHWGNHDHPNARSIHQLITRLLGRGAAPVAGLDELGDILEQYLLDQLAAEKRPSAHVLETLAVIYLNAPVRKDLAKALDRARRAVAEAPENPRCLRTLATVQEANDLLEEAVRTLEQAIRLPGYSRDHLDQLEEYRRRLLPDLASCASVDAALDQLEEGSKPGARVVAGLRALNERGPLHTYYQGRLSERLASFEEAVAYYEEALRLDPGAPEPRLRLAHSLIAAGRPSDAEQLVVRWIERSGHRELEPWERWVAIAWDGLGWSSEEALARLPHRETDVVLPSLVEDLEWLLAVPEGDDAIRINCGAREDYTDPNGNLWSRDRFFRGGDPRRLWPKQIIGSAAEELYVSERSFSRKRLGVGYRVPLPSGRYLLTLHVAEAELKGKGLRVFDVIVEGETRIPELEPLVQGYGAAWWKSVEVEVEDGRLDIGFNGRRGSPKLSAFEIKRIRKG